MNELKQELVSDPAFPLSCRRVALKRVLAIPITDGPHETPDLQPDGIPFVSAEAVENGGINLAKVRGFISQDLHRRYSLKCAPRNGDVFIVKSGATTGKVAFAHGLPEFNIWSPLALLRADESKVLKRFLFYAVCTDDFQTQIRNQWSFGTQQNIGMNVLGDLVISWPPLHLQRAVARSLDTATSAVETLIEKKRQLLRLLDEKQRALIHQAVTKGLSAGFALKDSGIPWIGRVPGHWVVSRLSLRLHQTLGKMLNPEAASGMAQRPYLTNRHVQWDRIITDELSTMNFSETERQLLRLQYGDILVCEGGEVGRAAIWQDQIVECYFQKALHRLRPRDPERDDTRFFLYALRAAANQGLFSSHGNTSTIIHLTGEQLKAHRFPFPPADEQRRIASYLDEHIASLKTAAATLDDSIRRLQEYRQALITAAVTGQLEITPDPA